MRRFVFITIFFLTSTTLLGCETQSYDDGYNAGFQKGYDKGWQEGYNEGLGKASQETTIKKELTLTDAPVLLNLLPFLPSTFEKVDASSEGLSNADVGLGKQFSEIQLFLSDDPFQMIYCFIAISQSRIEQVGFDSMMKDEEQIKSLLIENIQAGASEEGIDFQDPMILITYPAIGEFAVLGEGNFSSSGFTIGFDCIFFRENDVYVFVYSAYYTKSRQTLVPIAQELIRRISLYQ